MQAHPSTCRPCDANCAASCQIYCLSVNAYKLSVCLFYSFIFQVHEIFREMAFHDLRDKVQEAVATGSQNPSPFLHCTRDLNVAVALAKQRKDFYSGDIVEIYIGAWSKDDYIDLGAYTYIHMCICI